MDGMYSFATDATELTPLAIGEKYNASMGGVMANGRYFSSYQVDWWGVVQDNYNYLFDVQTWETLKSSDEASEDTFASALAYDPISNQVYGCFYGENGSELSTINIYSFERGPVIARIPSRYVAMGFTSAGQLYAIDSNSTLLKVDKSTGGTSTVGNTGLTLKYLTTGSIDQRTDRFFFAACNDDEKAIYEINLANGAATYVCDTPEDCEITGMWFPAPLAADKAPAAVRNLNVTFTRAELSGKVTFTAPTTLYDGTAASGALTYAVKANGVTVASGNTTCGANVDANISVPQAGMYTFTVTTSNATGEGPDVSSNLFAGPDTPMRVRDVLLTRSGNWNTLTWTKVTSMVNGGYLDPAEMTYTITRYPDGEVVKTGDKTGKFTEFLEQTSNGEPCYYEVKAVHLGVEGAPGKSNSFALGLLNVPFTEQFNSRADFNKWLNIDLTNQNRGWDFGGNTDKDAFCYNSLTQGVPMNAWLISPGIWMERGKLYTLSFDTHAYNDGITPERLEVAMGSEASAEGMTTTLMEPEIINYKNARTMTLEFSVPENGVYYIGFHGCSDPKTYFLYLDNVSMTAQTASVAAAAPGLKVIPNERGELTAVVDITCPELTTAGDPLTEISRLEVLRGETLIKTIETPAPGSKTKFVDTLPACGYYEYHAVAYTGNDPGMTASANVYIGVDYPGIPESAAVCDAPNGKATVSWTPVTVTATGSKLASDLVRYNIYDSEGTLVMADAEGDSATFDVEIPAQGQRFVSWSVRAVTERGESKDGKATPLFPVGEPYGMPVMDSFAGKKASINWALGRGSQGEWGFAENISTPLCSAQDSDGGMLVWVPDAEDASASIHSGRIAVGAAASDPQFSFYWFGVIGSTDFIQPLVTDLATGEILEIGDPVVMKDGTGWTKSSFSLVPFKGKDIQVGMKVVSRTYENIICMDNVRVVDQKACDMAALRLIVPASIKAGNEFEISAQVQNMGSQVARGYTVRLFRDGEQVAESNPATLGVDRQASVSFSQTLDSGSANVEYQAAVVLEGDEDPTNDTTPAVIVSISDIDLPTVTDLRAVRYIGENHVNLSWTPVSLEGGVATSIHESFEDGEAFAVNSYGDWTFIDGDEQATYGIEGMPFPHSGEAMAYILFDGDYSAFNSTFKASDGRRYLAAICPASGRNDDWAISPELSGNAQTVTFDARSYTTEYGREAFEFLYSTGGTDREDFVLAASEFVPGEWTSYSFEVPAGATHFAVRCISDQCFIFMLDNFRYEGLAGDADVSVIGYNIYRDGVRLNASPIADSKSVDPTPENDSHRYQASVVYSVGESPRGPEVEIEVSSIVRSVGESALRVAASKNMLWITATAGMGWEVIDSRGTTVRKGEGNGGCRSMTLESGLYVVRFADSTIRKIMVP